MLAGEVGMKRRRQELEELDAEIRDHLERETRENIERGIPEKEARYAALRKFGNVTRVKEEAREVWAVTWLETLLQDLRFGFRMLRKNPGFAAVAILTLALGVGANTAIFSVVYAVMLRPLPYANSERIYTVFQQGTQDARNPQAFSYPMFVDLREHNAAFIDVGGVQQHQLALTGHGDAVLIDTSVVTAGFFEVFEGKPLLGRVLLPEDSKPEAAPVVVLSESLWRSIFHSDANIVGSAITLDQRAYTVVGVMPEAFRFPEIRAVNQVWVPLAQDPLYGGWMERAGTRFLFVNGRLKPGVSAKQVQAEMEVIDARLSKEYPAESKGWVTRVEPLQKNLVGDVEPALLVLLGAVGLVLLLACANIANLLLSRATSRTREIAVRTTLGAGRGRIMRQLLSETAALGVLGGIAGILLAYWGVRGLSSLLPENFPLVNGIALDWTVLGFALGIAVVASLLAGVAPAFVVVKSSVVENLRGSGARSGQGGGGHLARSVLAGAEIAMAMVLLVTAGLLLRSFSKLTQVNPGFKAENVLKAEVSLPRFEYSTQQQYSTFSDELLGRLQAEPGLKNAAIAIPAPIGDNSTNLPFEIVGQAPAPPGTRRTADYESISANYFGVMQIPLLAGRMFDERDAAMAPKVTIISKALAQIYFPNEDSIGKQLAFADPPGPTVAREIVGVVGDVRDRALGDEPKPMMYVPYEQATFPGAVLLVRSTLSPANIVAAIRKNVGALDKNLPVTDVATMPEIVEKSTADARFRTLLLTLFAAMALVLAATGIFGVISHAVECRTQEIGIRIALGASAVDILGMVSRKTLGLMAGGLVVGVPAALGASRLLGHLLFGVPADDPVTLVGVVLAIVVVAGVASYVPMRRAVSVEPVVALRQE
jgi:predicted permease